MRAVDDALLAALFKRIEDGDEAAMAELLPVVYDELRRVAAGKLALESGARTLQPTALVHEAWLRLGGDSQPQWKGRGHFFSAAAEAMRRILIDHARKKLAARRGSGAEHVSLEKTGLDVGAMSTDDDELLRLNEALEELAEVDPRRADLVKQRYFVGLTFEEVADASGLSLRTVKRDWAYARAWLLERMNQSR